MTAAVISGSGAPIGICLCAAIVAIAVAGAVIGPKVDAWIERWDPRHG